MSINYCQALKWSELDPEKQKSHYWAAISNDPDTIIDGWNYEIIYVYYDGKWSVFRMNESKWFSLNDFRFLFMIDLPELSIEIDRNLTYENT